MLYVGVYSVVATERVELYAPWTMVNRVHCKTLGVYHLGCRSSPNRLSTTRDVDSL